MVSQLLVLPDEELDEWRQQIVDAIGPSMVPSVIALLDPEVRRPLNLEGLIGDVTARSAIDPSHRSALWAALHAFTTLFYSRWANPVVIVTDDVRHPRVRLIG